MIKAWVEAMRLRTLPVSLAGVVTAAGYAFLHSRDLTNWGAAALCLVFATLCQIASNFANEYYDYRNGLDRRGREGPRRGVTEGDITPRAMKTATYATLAAGCAVGLVLAWTGGWWLIGAGVVIALGAMAYSAGPYPLSSHCLGEVAVIFFFGIVPVNLTYYLCTGGVLFDPHVMEGSLAIGLLGANVLVVNNYRDRADDAAVGKTTLAVRYGGRAATGLYLANGVVAAALLMPTWRALAGGPAVPLLLAICVGALWRRIRSLEGAALNPMLGMTAMTMAAYSIAFLIAALFC